MLERSQTELRLTCDGDDGNLVDLSAGGLGCFPLVTRSLVDLVLAPNWPGLTRGGWSGDDCGSGSCGVLNWSESSDFGSGLARGVLSAGAGTGWMTGKTEFL